MQRINDFLTEIDRRWTDDSANKLTLRIIGSAALMLQTGYERGTKDSDILETAALTTEIQKRLREIAGEGTELHKRHRMYLDIVSSGFPFLPATPRYHSLAEINRTLKHFHFEVLDVVDVVGSSECTCYSQDK